MATRTVYRRATLVVIGIWALACLATLTYNGPFFDEGIYITAGQRTLEGHGLSDGYLGWFAGSLLWPVVAAFGYHVAGIAGARAIAVVLSAITLAAVAQATRNLFGERAGFWAAVTLALNGAFLALARLGVYDTPALTGVAISFWAVTEFVRRNNRVWLIVAASAFTVAVFNKYPVALMLPIILGSIYVLRREKAALDIGIFGFVGAVLMLAFMLPLREQLVPLPTWQLANRASFDITRSMIGFTVLYLGWAPVLFALIGLRLAHEQRRLAILFIGSLAIWPAYHLITGDGVSISKHLVFGFLFAYPLVGLLLAVLWDQRKSLVPVVIVGLAAIGLMQVDQASAAWPDMREPAHYLVEHVQPGQKLLINHSWPYTMYLYMEGRIRSPWDVFDVYRLTHDESQLELCNYDWFVDVQGSYTWPASIRNEIAACGRFEQVFSTTRPVVGLGPDLRYVQYPVNITIWHNGDNRNIHAHNE